MRSRGGAEESRWRARVATLSNSVSTGFRLACANGPLCAEAVTGALFRVEKLRFKNDETAEARHTLAAVKEACLGAFRRWGDCSTH